MLYLLPLLASNKAPTSEPTLFKKALQHKRVCAQARAESDLNVNNVRAQLLVGGDVWWNGSDGRYIFPNVTSGEEVSSIFVAGL